MVVLRGRFFNNSVSCDLKRILTSTRSSSKLFLLKTLDSYKDMEYPRTSLKLFKKLKKKALKDWCVYCNANIFINKKSILSLFSSF